MSAPALTAQGSFPAHPADVIAMLDRNAASIGHNGAPAPTPFEASRDEIEELFAEAKNFLDGEPITTQAMADAVGRLMDKLRQAEKRADERRKAEAKVFDDGKAEVQGRYNPLIQAGKGKTALGIDACKRALRPYLEAQEAERRAEAQRAREAAEAAQRAAQEALRASQADNLAQREAAERLVSDAKAAERVAGKAESARASVAGGARAIGMRKSYVATLTDRREAARFFWLECPDQFDALLTRLGQDFVAAGRRELPGFAITEERTVR